MSLTLAVDELSTFLSNQRRRIAAAFTEIEQVQVEYQGAYTRFKADHDKTLRALTGQIESRADGTGRALQPLIEARLPQEQQGILQQIADFEKQSAQLQARTDELLALNQKAAANLRETNPKLNEREETLKADVARQQQALVDLNAQINQLGKGLGFVLHAAKIHALDRERLQILGRLQQLEEELRKVRQDWRDLSADAAKSEAGWQAQWRQQTAQLSQVRQQRDYLEHNTATEAQHRATVVVLDNLKTLPAGGDASMLQPMIDLNIQTDNFQAALGSVASILGLLKGVDEGLKRLDESVQALIAEQQRHSAFLPRLSVTLDDQVTTFGQTWDDLIAKSKDEKTLATHPADFVTAMQPFLEQRLTQDRIAAFFNALGKALNAATADWRGA
jgi:hypothetical protein